MKGTDRAHIVDGLCLADDGGPENGGGENEDSGYHYEKSREDKRDGRFEDSSGHASVSSGRIPKSEHT